MTELSALRPGEIVLTIAQRGRTSENIYDYNYWKCPRCGYWPGGSDGPPAPRCLNCHKSLYVESREDMELFEVQVLKLIKKDCILALWNLGYEVLRTLPPIYVREVKP